MDYHGDSGIVVPRGFADTNSNPCPRHFECFYEKVIKVKADVAALLNLFSDVSIDVRW